MLASDWQIIFLNFVQAEGSSTSVDWFRPYLLPCFLMKNIFFFLELLMTGSLIHVWFWNFFVIFCLFVF